MSGLATLIIGGFGIQVKARRIVRARKLRTTKRIAVTSVLAQFHCRNVSYHFEIPITSFNAKEFFRESGIRAADRWTATLLPKDRDKGYHVHFRGYVDSKHMHLTIEYWDGARKAAADDEVEPFAESIMQWVGLFVKEPTSRTIVFAHFQKPLELWRSRFNLPFKVTMANAEVVIDGVSLVLPRNPFRAGSAFLARTETNLLATVQLLRTVEFGTFNISDEIVAFNDSAKMFLEPV